MSGLSEFDLIRRFFEGLTPRSDSAPLKNIIQLGIGDDCAVIDVPDGMSLCMSIDTMVEGVHFPPHAPADKLAYRALAAALSDLAAMGAQPSHFTLSLTMPSADQHWLASFSKGLKALVTQFQLSLVGGDTTKGPLSISIQVHGFLPKNTALTRSDAKAGDIVAVTGTLGDAGVALSLLGKSKLNIDEQFLLNRYYHPSPRIEQGVMLRSKANACIDISDGLLADAEHIANKSQVQLEIDLDKLPVSKALKSLAESSAKNKYSSKAKRFGKDNSALDFAMNGGDDYELLFTLPETQWNALLGNANPEEYTAIGRVKPGEGVIGMINGQEVSILNKGFKHFE